MPLKRHYRKASPLTARLKRGDTVIEVMFALSVFCLVAVISIAMMNLGVAQAENALEIVVTRNELNAQAEALRFIHSSFISEKTLPTYSELTPTQRADGEKYQQYADLWHEIVRNAIAPNEAAEITDLENTIFTPSETTGVVGCDRLYDGGDNSILSRKKAFILNTRDLNSTNLNGVFNVGVSYISAVQNVGSDKQFVPSPLNARVIFARPNASETGDLTNSTTQFTDGSGLTYNRVSQSEGIWIVALTDGTSTPQYYDFYIQSCWYGPNTTSPTSIDTVIRLYNPENV